MENININWNELSDNAVLEQIGRFVQQSRLHQNKSQQQVADAAGVNRSTLSQIENGKGGNTNLSDSDFAGSKSVVVC